MKKLVAALALVALSAASASALTIVNSKHDMSSASSATVKGGSVSQICIYCHTPHNPQRPIPLWNRTNPTNTDFKLYTSSASLTSATKTAALGTDSISLFCLSCHDGRLGLGSAVVRKGTDATALTAFSATLTTTGNLTTDLTNDHPIGFSYVNAQAQDLGALRDKATATTNLGGGAPFFGAAADQMECASCHKVHDNAFAPFLRTSNARSNLCLACHNK